MMKSNNLQFQARFTQHSAIFFGIGLLLLLIVTYLIYRPGITGGLLLDDFWNLRAIGENGGITSFDSFRQFVFNNNSGPTGRPVSMASFLIDGQNWPPYVPSFKYTNILIHLLSGVTLCWFALLLSQALNLNANQSSWFALAVAGIWLLHPLNISTVLYVVQRMTQLMTLFALAALVCYLSGRRMLDSNPFRAAILLGLCLFPFGLLSVLSKENGALLLLLILVMEFTIFQERSREGVFKLWFYAGVLFPLLIVIGYLIYSAPENLALYDIRSFSLSERLLTETRILVTYLSKILLPNITGDGLYHDDLLVSTSLLQPMTTLFSLALLLGIFGSAIYLRRTQPVYAFAVFWFFTMHILESSYVPLELYFEHRNYMAMIGPLFAIAWYVREIFQGASRRLANALKVIVPLILTISIWLTWTQTTIWSDVFIQHTAWANEKPRSIRAQITLADYLNLAGLPELGMERLQLAHSFYPNEVTIALFMWNQSCEYDLPAPLSLDDIANNRELEYYRDDVNHHLQTLIENLIQETCEFPELATLESLFDRIGELPLPDPRRTGYHVHYSDLYVYYGMLDPALINLSRAFALSPVPDFPIRQAIMAASAGNFSDGLVFLGRARVAEENNNPLLPSTMDEINRLEQDFNQRLRSGAETPN